MNISYIVTSALNRANLSVNDIDMRGMALDMLNELIQEHWTYKEWGFRKLSSSISTVAAQTEYSLNKRVGAISDILNFSMRGSDPVRILNFFPTSEFYKQYPYTPINGDPYNYYIGKVQGFSTNPSAASVITFTSSFTNYTTGTVAIVKGSQRVVFGGGASIPLTYLGASIRFGTDTRAYRLQRRDLQSTTIYYLDSPYEGTSNGTATYAIGDVSQTVTVVGYIGTSLQEEEVQLNGNTAVSTTGQFATILRISKSDFTMGYITATSNSAGVTNVILDPGEMEVDILTINLYPIPTKVETINYDFLARHPFMYKASDSPLFPSQYHNLLLIDLYIKLMTEWSKKEPSPVVMARREKLFNLMVDIDNNTDNWKKLQESEYFSTRHKIMNLPPAYGSDYGFAGEMF